jgi:hypothetical protein
METPACVASNEALGSLFHAVATVAGGIAFDWLRSTSTNTAAEPYRSCLVILLTGLVMRGVGVVLLAAIDEPGAWTWREILAGKRATTAGEPAAGGSPLRQPRLENP